MLNIILVIVFTIYRLLLSKEAGILKPQSFNLCPFLTLSSPNHCSPNNDLPKIFPIMFHPIHVSSNTTFYPNPISPNSHFAQTTLTKKITCQFYFEFIKVAYIRIQLIFYSSTAQVRPPLGGQT